MRTVNFYLSGNSVHDYVIRALYDGCPEKKNIIERFEYSPADVGVVFGMFKSQVPVSWERGGVYVKHRQAGEDVIVLETGYVFRGDGANNYYAAGFNGLNGRADFKNKSSPSDRFLQLGVNVEPWRVDGGHVVVCGQVPWDASVDHIDFNEWARDTMMCLKDATSRRVVFRHHPCIDPNVPPLSQAMKGAWAVVTFNSNSAVEAAIQGIPVFVSDEGSMALSVANTDLTKIENPETPDRMQWLCDLAYAQWTPMEMRSGLTWAHLFDSGKPS